MEGFPQFAQRKINFYRNPPPHVMASVENTVGFCRARTIARISFMQPRQRREKIYLNYQVISFRLKKCIAAGAISGANSII